MDPCPLVSWSETGLKHAQNKHTRHYEHNRHLLDFTTHIMLTQTYASPTGCYTNKRTHTHYYDYYHRHILTQTNLLYES